MFAYTRRPNSLAQTNNLKFEDSRKKKDHFCFCIKKCLVTPCCPTERQKVGRNACIQNVLFIRPMVAKHKKKKKTASARLYSVRPTLFGYTNDGVVVVLF